MFKRKKVLEEIRKEKEALLKEKQELLFIKNELENNSPKIDITNVYILEDKGIYSIVRLDIQNIVGENWAGNEVNAFKSTLRDIFTNNLIFEKNSMEKIKQSELNKDCNGNLYHMHLYHLHKFNKNILAYTNKKVPLYVLKQLYYNLNKIDIDAHILKLTK